MTVSKKVKPPKIKREKSTSSEGHYVDKVELLNAVLEAKKIGKVTDKLISMIWAIAEHYSRKHNFIGYSFRSDMVSAAVENMCKNALKFDAEKYDNPFAYYTQSVYHSFLQYLADEKRHRNIRDALLIDAGSNPSFNFLEGERDEQHFEISESDEYFLPDVDVEVENLDNITVRDELAELLGENEPVPAVIKREEKHRYAHRLPGAVKRYGPNDIEIDADGNITIKTKPDAKVKKTKVSTPNT